MVDSKPMWRSYGEAAMEEARERGVPMMLVLGAELCPRTRALKAALEEAQGPLEDRFVCVYADKDEYPELDRRHRGAGWPAVSLLKGDPAYGGTVDPMNVVDPARAAGQILGAIEEGAAISGEKTASREASAAAIDAICDMLVETADPEFGGWGARQKFPHPDALHLMLVRWSETGEERYRQTVVRTLRSMQEREIKDPVEGGFFRFATQRDWSVPNYEKPLLSNAKRMLAYAEAYQALGEPSFMETAKGVARWMESALLDGATGAFRAAQELDPAYARMGTLEARRKLPTPTLDPVIYADQNAWAAIGLFKAGAVFGDRSLVERGLDALDFVTERLFRPDRGVFHYWNGSWNQPGDLRDQGAVLRALVDGVHYAGENRLLGPALEVAGWTVDHLDSPDGTFRADLHQAPTAASRRSADDLRHNAVMGEALIRLGVLLQDRRWMDRGRTALEAFLGSERPHGFATAGFARALDLLVHEPVRVLVVGGRTDARRSALFEAALRPYVASRVAAAIDPAEDESLASRLSLRAPNEAPYAVIERASRTYAITEDASRLPALMTGSERA